MKNKVVLFALLLSPLFLFAHNGSINGRITEKASGLELPGATVRLEPGGRYTTTNTLGLFSFSNLPAGVYTLTVNCVGYESQTAGAVTVRDSETSVLRIELTPASVNL